MGSAFSFLLKPNKPIYFAILTMHNYMGSCIVVNSERVHKLLNPCLASACEWINISHAFTNLTLVSFLYFWHSITAAITISSTSEHGNYQQTFSCPSHYAKQPQCNAVGKLSVLQRKETVLIKPPE